ncbi:bestrophin family protein [Rivihabitans pingtungensis]|uniref:bestrophin family protein n=1 Tax=Rivihabitans pingtungensis TaxID=1054498 RepID=UPI0023EF5B86|nr:bestrophin family ion channel [Rivihabitans pingtungensis]
MIIRPRPHWLAILFARRGSVLPSILPQLGLVTALAVAITASHGVVFGWKTPLTPMPFTLVGIALAIFLGFRNSASYDRYWEARKFWGQGLNECRTLTRQALSLMDGQVDVRPFVYGQIAFIHALRGYLRRVSVERELAALLPAELLARLRDAHYPPTLILVWLGQWLHEQRRAGHLQAVLAAKMEDALSGLNQVQGGCERIVSSPIPFAYTVILYRTVGVYCLLLPFGLVDTLGWMTPLVTAFVSYTFFAQETLLSEIEEPFGNAENDLPLDALSITIERTLREMLGEATLPDMPAAKDFVLT